jgi:hypothetical protein
VADIRVLSHRITRWEFVRWDLITAIVFTIATTAFLITIVFHNHFFHHHNRFFFGFDFAAFGFPDWWYPYDWYPYDYYANSDYSPVYDYRYWYGLATAVQTELAARGYYHGQIDGVIGSDSRHAIQAFQEAKGLPVTGMINPGLLKALNLPQVPRVT